MFLVQVDVVPQELDVYLLTVLEQRRQGQLQREHFELYYCQRDHKGNIGHLNSHK